MKDDALVQMFAGLLFKQFGATMVTFPAPTPEQLADMGRREQAVAAMSDAELIVAWEAGDDTYCDEIWAEGQRRGLGDRISV